MAMGTWGLVFLVAMIVLVQAAVAWKRKKARVQEARALAPLYLEALRLDGDALSTLLLARGLESAASVTTGVQAAREHRERALRAAHDDPYAAVLALAFSGTDVEGAHARWRGVVARAADENAFFAIAMLAEPVIRNDPGARATWLARAAEASHYAGPCGPALRSLLPRIEATQAWQVMQRETAPGSIRRNALDLALTLTSTAPFPIFLPFELCKQAEGEAREHGRRLARLMWDSESLMDALLGTAISIRLAGEAAAGEQARATQRRLFWWREKSSYGEPPASEESDRAYVAAVLARGEVAAMRERLQAAGIPLEPPTQWQPTQSW
jgi:hypothetical protein